MFEKILGRSQFYNAFFGLRKPEPGTIFLRQKRVYILPTRHGLAFAVALIVMLIGSINYNLSLGYVLTFLLASMALVAILHTFRNLVHLRITPGRVEPVFAEETAWFELFIENHAGYDRCSISLWHQGKAIQCDLASGRGATVTVAVAAEKRGWLAPERITVDTRFPVGLLRAWSYIQPDMRCLVYPRPDDGRLPLPEPAGGRGEKRVAGGGSDDFAGLRAYQTGDSPRHIDWKAAARAADQSVQRPRGRRVVARLEPASAGAGPRVQAVAPDALGAPGRSGRIALRFAPARYGVGAGHGRATPPRLPAGTRAV